MISVAVNRFVILSIVILNLCLLLYLFRSWMFHNEITTVDEKTILRKDFPEFIPSNEWQRVKKDQPLPKGMHVKINLATGEREAKIWKQEPNEKSDSTNSVILSNNDKSQDVPENLLNENELKKALKKIKNDFYENPSETDTSKDKKKFRTYEELKNEMSALNLNIKTDAEVLLELMTHFKDSLQHGQTLSDKDEHVFISTLTDLEYILHQIDNANEFVRQNGMSDIIVPSLVCNSTKIRQAAARVLGSAVQNNAVAQIAALEAGIIPHLLRIIALEKHYEVKSSALYALSCLIRAFPHAQLNFVESGGLSVFIALFDDNSQSSLKLQLKTISFLSDLLQEKLDVEQSISEQNSDATKLSAKKFEEVKEKLRQYNLIHLNTKLVERGWCLRLGEFLVSNSFKDQANHAVLSFINSVEPGEDIASHELVDQTANAILPLAKLCQNDLGSVSYFNETLLYLTKYYASLAAKDKEDTYYLDIFKLLHELCLKLQLPLTNETII